MSMSILANIHPEQLEFYFVSIINYIDYWQGPGLSVQASCRALTAQRFPSLQKYLLRNLMVKQILHLPHYHVEFGAVVLPLQVSQQWVCSSLQGSKPSREGGAGRGSCSSLAAVRRDVQHQEWQSHTAMNQLGEWMLEVKGQGGKGWKE